MCVIVWRQENATEFILKCRISGRWRWATPGLHYQTIKSLRENTVSPLTSTGVCRAFEIHTFKFLSNGDITALIVCVSFGIFKDKTILHHTCVLCDSSGTEPVCFEDMTLGLDEVRRLSTESSVLFPSFILTTTWIWYWRDQYDHWIQYASLVHVTWIKKLILQDTGIQILPREMFLPIIFRSSFLKRTEGNAQTVYGVQWWPGEEISEVFTTAEPFPTGSCCEVQSRKILISVEF